MVQQNLAHLIASIVSGSMAVQVQIKRRQLKRKSACPLLLQRRRRRRRGLVPNVDGW